MRTKTVDFIGNWNPVKRVVVVKSEDVLLLQLHFGLVEGYIKNIKIHPTLLRFPDEPPKRCPYTPAPSSFSPVPLWFRSKVARGTLFRGAFKIPGPPLEEKLLRLGPLVRHKISSLYSFKVPPPTFPLQ